MAWNWEASHKVHRANALARRQAYEADPKHCGYCDTPLPYGKRRHRFCSHSCAAKSNNQGVRRHGRSPKVCGVCGDPVPRSNLNHCSRRCSSQAKKEARRRQVLDSKSLDGMSPRTAKGFLLEERGVCCEICGRKTWKALDGSKVEIPLVMDHIDGNASNNALANLRLVCGNCDMLLPTYKSKNNGNGRHRRRRRYAEGKSY